MVERFNGCIADVLKTPRFNCAEGMGQTLMWYVPPHSLKFRVLHFTFESADHPWVNFRKNGMFKNLKIGMRIGLAFGLLVFLCALSGRGSLAGGNWAW